MFSDLASTDSLSVGLRPIENEEAVVVLLGRSPVVVHKVTKAKKLGPASRSDGRDMPFCGCLGVYESESSYVLWRGRGRATSRLFRASRGVVVCVRVCDCVCDLRSAEIF